MKPSLLQLERSFFTKIELDADLTATEAPQKFASRISSGAAEDDPLRFQVTLAVSFGPEDRERGKSSYRGELEAVGMFKIAEQVPEDQRARTVVVSGCTLLFGMIREHLALLTARGPWPMFVLPTVTFQDLKPVGPVKVGEAPPMTHIALPRPAEI